MSMSHQERVESYERDFRRNNPGANEETVQHYVDEYRALVTPVKHWADHCPTAKPGDVLHAPEDEADCTTCSPAAIDASEPCCITSAQTRGVQHHVTCEEY